ncbi:MAG: ABC transporter substrate-binding protein [Chloroflexi bacterium]|nr:ABC transporter substrate-binding protein [Chloroflexota bacterium]
MSEARKLNRRDFLRGSAIAAVGIVAASCAAPTPVIVEKQVPVEKVVKETVVVEKQVPVEKVVKETVVVSKEVAIEKVVTATPIPAKFFEAPALAEQVKAGKLPPVDERLPIDPFVVEPIEQVGTYGGIWRQLHRGANDWMQNSYYLRERVAKFTPDFTKIVPNVCASWQFSGDAKELTINLRRGMKWSDGKPFSADAITYWWNDIAMYKDISPNPPTRYRMGTDVATLTKIDDYTVKFTFPKAYGSFEDFLPSEEVYAPGHYLKQFHAKYTQAAALDAAVKAEGVNTWVDLHSAKNDLLNAPGRPTIHPWEPTNKQDQPVQVFVRNPYYWKVDTDGNQLPYLDGIERTLLPDAQAILLKALAGDTDYGDRNIASLANRAVVVENAQKGDYRVLPTLSPGTNWGTTFLNFWHKDPYLKELFNNAKFRIALSVAINREEMAALTEKGQVKPGQATVAIGSPWFEEKYLKNYIEYDPAQANKLLDELGLDKKDAEGYRLRPDGKRLSLIESILGTTGNEIQRGELRKGYYKDVGIEVTPKGMETSLWVQHVHACEHDLAVYAANLGFFGNPPIVRTETFFVQQHYVSELWAIWYASGGAQGEEPPADIKKIQGLFEQIKAEASAEKRVTLSKEALQMHADNLYMIGFAPESDLGRYCIARNNFRNLPDFPFDVETLHTASFFIKK